MQWGKQVDKEDGSNRSTSVVRALIAGFPLFDWRRRRSSLIPLLPGIIFRPIMPGKSCR